jgi:hypothetical protein
MKPTTTLTLFALALLACGTEVTENTDDAESPLLVETAPAVPSTAPAQLVVSNSATVYRGYATLTAHMTSTSFAVIGQSVAFYVDGKWLVTATTDRSGNATATPLLPAYLGAGPHSLTAQVVNVGTSANVAGLDVVKAPIDMWATLDPAVNATFAPASGYAMEADVQLSALQGEPNAPSAYQVAGPVTITFKGVTKTVTTTLCGPPQCQMASAFFQVGPSDYGQTLSAVFEFGGDANHLPTSVTRSILVQTPNAALPKFNMQFWGNFAEWKQNSQGLVLGQSHDILVQVTDGNGAGVPGLTVSANGIANDDGCDFESPNCQIDFGYSPGVTDGQGYATIPFTYVSPRHAGSYMLGGGLVYQNQWFPIDAWASSYMMIDETDFDYTIGGPTSVVSGGTAHMTLGVLVDRTQKPPPAGSVFFTFQKYEPSLPNNVTACSVMPDASGNGACDLSVPAGTLPGLFSMELIDGDSSGGTGPLSVPWATWVGAVGR